MEPRQILESAFYFLALINPSSKVLLLSSMQPRYRGRELWGVCIRSTLVALTILILLGAAGQFLLQNIFRINLYSLKVAGGAVLFFIGATAATKGRFFEKSFHHQSSEIWVVPLGAPLIAGPGTITAAIAYSAEYGILSCTLALLLALLLNLVFMLCSEGLANLLERTHAMGPLIRITGLIVAAVSVQMVLSGLGEWLQMTLRAVSQSTL